MCYSLLSGFRECAVLNIQFFTVCYGQTKLHVLSKSPGSSNMTSVVSFSSVLNIIKSVNFNTLTQSVLSFSRRVQTTEMRDERLKNQMRGKEGEERGGEGRRRGGMGKKNQQAIITLIWSPY